MKLIDAVIVFGRDLVSCRGTRVEQINNVASMVQRNVTQRQRYVHQHVANRWRREIVIMEVHRLKVIVVVGTWTGLFMSSSVMH